MVLPMRHDLPCCPPNVPSEPDGRQVFSGLVLSVHLVTMASQPPFSLIFFRPALSRATDPASFPLRP